MIRACTVACLFAITTDAAPGIDGFLSQDYSYDTVSLLQTALHITEDKRRMGEAREAPVSLGNEPSFSIRLFGDTDEESVCRSCAGSVCSSPANNTEDAELIKLATELEETGDRAQQIAEAATELEEVVALCDVTGEDCDYDASIGYTELSGMQLGMGYIEP
mmetsp:Transcript_99480/g.176544  ORF Transcript_99480/g.176544 Transcript_99480/m.176544 type:complete len:162 (+) Transcript_99480:3-488(+)